MTNSSHNKTHQQVPTIKVYHRLECQEYQNQADQVCLEPPPVLKEVEEIMEVVDQSQAQVLLLQDPLKHQHKQVLMLGLWEVAQLKWEEAHLKWEELQPIRQYHHQSQLPEPLKHIVNPQLQLGPWEEAQLKWEEAHLKWFW